MLEFDCVKDMVVAEDVVLDADRPVGAGATLTEEKPSFLAELAPKAPNIGIGHANLV